VRYRTGIADRDKFIDQTACRFPSAAVHPTVNPFSGV
jgi:hypothetical protein